MKDIDFGEIKLHLDEIRKKQNISINKLACRAEMQRSQVRSYCNNTIQRLDMAVLARLLCRPWTGKSYVSNTRTL